MTTISSVKLAEVFNEWMRLYIDEPEKFQSSWTSMKEFLLQEDQDLEPTYGTECAAFVFKIAESLDL
jgi:hypothetical protein